MSRAPRTCVSILDQQSDATEASVSCVDRDSASSAIWNSVYGTSFSGKRVLELWPILFAAVHDFGAFSCGTDPGNSGTSEQPSHATLINRSNSCGSQMPKIRTAALSCMCPEPTASSDPVEQTPYSCSEAVGNSGSRSHQNDPRRWTKRGVRNGNRTRRQSLKCGTSSRRRVMSTASSASPSCCAPDEFFILRDVSIPPGTSCPAYLGHQEIFTSKHSNTS